VSEKTFTDAVVSVFEANPNAWVDAEALMLAGGRYAWRSRVSDCRTRLGMTIENRLRKVGERTVSEYRFVPRAVPVQAALFEGAA
jgi:hypothetical protein